MQQSHIHELHLVRAKRGPRNQEDVSFTYGDRNSFGPECDAFVQDFRSMTTARHKSEDSRVPGTDWDEKSTDKQNLESFLIC